jgi:hypothetical protein
MFTKYLRFPTGTLFLCIIVLSRDCREEFVLLSTAQMVKSLFVAGLLGLASQSIMTSIPVHPTRIYIRISVDKGYWRHVIYSILAALACCVLFAGFILRVYPS